MTRDRRNRVVDPELVPAAAMVGLATPGEILTRMRLVDADVRALDDELRSQRAQVQASFRSGWAHWRDAWRHFFRDNQGFAARAWPGTLNEVEAFAHAAAGLAERGRARGRAPRVSQREPVAHAHVAAGAGPAPPGRAPALGAELLQPLRDLAHAVPTPAEMADSVRHALEETPLSARYWESLKPVAIAGAVTVGGIGLLWLLWHLREANGGVLGGSIARRAVGGDAAELERLLPMLASEGVIVP